MRKKMDGGLSITTITKLLENVKSPKSYTTLRMTSKPVYSSGFIKYLNWCKNKKFVEWDTLTANNNHQIVEYSLSQKGRQFLEMIE